MVMRGTTARGAEAAVLEDASGRRARWMRRVGRVVFLLFLAWLVAIVLGGLGLTPVPGIPFTHSLRPSQGPPPLTRLPRPRPPSASDLRPALPAAALTPQGRHGRPAGKPVQARGRSSLAPGQGGAPRGRSTTAPGHTKTSPSGVVPRGRSTTAPGQTKTSPSGGTPRGRSTTAPGQTKTSPSGSQPAAPPGRLRTSTSPVPPRRP